MTKEVLHISHHIGCFRDQEYVLNKLGFEVTNHKFYDGVFHITEDIANDFWKNHKDQLNDFDYILTSDTAPLSRIFLENQDEFTSKLIVWICNRFDYRMETEKRYYELFSKAEQNPNIKIIPSTHWEIEWCKMRGTTLSNTPIPPNGKMLMENEKNIPESSYFSEMYGSHDELPDADVVIPIYHNDNRFINMKQFLEERGISSYNGGFTYPSQLKKYKAFVTLPDTFCKWFAFESIHEGIPVVLPSEQMLYKLSREPNYFYNVWGSGGAELLTPEMISWGEWYRPEFKECRFYFDSFDEIPDIINSIDYEKLKPKFEKASKNIEDKILKDWKTVYDSLG